ncbi:MAG: DUF3237 family protein [Clostridia bacterium]|nr:DUF3237 family protein [Clostridia bacterium]
MSEPIMIFNITIKPEEISHFESASGQVTIIPFGGSVKSDIFSGKVLPGAADVQVTNAAGIRHMCAKYMFEGVDMNGNACHLFVENNGYFEPNSSPSPFHACPIFMTDSEALSFLTMSKYRAEGHGTENGVDIYIFDTSK